MKIDVYLKGSTIFAGNIDGKGFNFIVEEFINLIGAFQKKQLQIPKVLNYQKKRLYQQN